MRTLALLALAPLLAACRSDGGIDRRDSGPSLEFSTSRVAAQTRADADATADHVTRAPAALADHVSRAWHDLGATWTLYLEGHASR